MRISSLQARRLAVHAQDLDGPVTTTTPTRSHLKRALDHLGVLQIDAVNAIARSHLLVLRARLGGEHDHVRDLLERAAYRSRDLAEYWCHEASFVPVEDWPLFRWRMDRARQGELYKSLARFGEERRELLDAVLAHITQEGAVSAGELEPGGRKGPWWGWSDSKIALEYLFWVGDVTVSRRDNFTRYYDLPERVLPEQTARQAPPEAEAHRTLLLMAASHLGVGAADDIVDYHRLPKRDGKARLAELVENGDLDLVEVDGWDRPGYMLPGTALPRRPSRSVLLSPFDPIVWFRPRAERLYGFEYRIEIYVPAPKRVYGYYVLPFLHDDQLRARLDLKADRAAGVLRVNGSYAEFGLMDRDATDALGGELWSLARFCGLDEVDVAPRGDLAAALRDAVATTGRA